MDIRQRQQAIGAFFRDYRERSGVSLREAAGNVMSAAKLSRFERGETNISTDTAMALMHRLGMQVSEFVRLSNESTYALPANSAAVWLRDWPRLSRTNSAYLEAHAEDPHTWLQDIIRLLFKAQGEPLSSPVHLSAHEEWQLDTFLAYPHYWRRVEMNLVEACAPLASAEWRKTCWARLGLVSDMTDHQVEQLAIRQALLTAAVKFGEWETFMAELPVLVKHLDSPSLRGLLNDRVTAAALLKQIGLWHAAGEPTKWTPINELLTAVKTVHVPRVGPYLREIWACARHPQSPHHHHLNGPLTLESTPDQADAGLFSGPDMAALRERRQISLRESSIAWSPSTQLRFERGETQLGIARLDLLKDFLLSSWRDLISSHYNFHDNLVAHYRSQVGTYYHAGKLNEASGHALADEFAARANDLALPVRTLQRWEVLAYAYTGVAAQLPAADLAAIQHLLEKATGWNGDLVLLFADVAKDLPAALTYRLWRTLYKLEGVPKCQVANPFNVDFTVAVSIALAKNTKLAGAMKKDLNTIAGWQTMQYPNVWSLYAHLAILVCQWTQRPTEAMKVMIDRYIQAMAVLGYPALANDARETLAAVLTDTQK